MCKSVLRLSDFVFTDTLGSPRIAQLRAAEARGRRGPLYVEARMHPGLRILSPKPRSHPSPQSLKASKPQSLKASKPQSLKASKSQSKHQSLKALAHRTAEVRL